MSGDKAILVSKVHEEAVMPLYKSQKSGAYPVLPSFFQNALVEVKSP